MKCHTAICLSQATKAVYWPGRALKFCDPCTSRAEGIAQAMGFPLTVQTLEALQVVATVEAMQESKP